ncbi:MAG: thiamine phosphate synthase [Phycisphaerales bacterium]
MDRAIYRIVDANYNRAREGLRVAEEFCRFALDNQQLSGRCKEIRHKLSALVAKFDVQRLITARDTENDVGCGLQIDEQMKRQSLEDCVTAGLARTVEAIRAITEAVSVVDGMLPQTFEKLRYDCYTLEKDISLFGFPAIKFKNTRLYCIITMQSGIDVLKIAQDCAAGGADCMQLRAKNISDSQLLPLAREFVKIGKDNNVLTIINDRADIAIASQADGVHLGQNDLPASAVRQMQTKPLIIGISTHSQTELSSAIEQNPHYVGVGSVFCTTTKDNVEVCGLNYVKAATEFLKNKFVEAVAIGGITLENVQQVLDAGAKRIAVSSCICNAEKPAEICKKFKEVLDKYI